MCPNELKMNSECQKYIRVYQTPLKSVLNQYFFWKHQFELNNHNIVMITFLMTKSLRKYFLKELFLIFVGFLDFFVIKDLVLIWALDIEWQAFYNFDFKRLYSKKSHLLTIKAQVCVKKN